jgi:hypothetical protein
MIYIMGKSHKHTDCSDSGSDTSSCCSSDSDRCNDVQIEGIESMRAHSRSKKRETEDKYEEYVKSVYRMWKEGTMTEIDLAMLKDIKKVFKRMVRKHFDKESKAHKLNDLYEVLQVVYYIYYWNKHHKKDCCESKKLDWLARFDKTYNVWNSTAHVDHVAAYTKIVGDVVAAEAAVDAHTDDAKAVAVVVALKTARKHHADFSDNFPMVSNLIGKHEHNKHYEKVFDDVEDRMKEIKQDL